MHELLTEITLSQYLEVSSGSRGPTGDEVPLFLCKQMRNPHGTHTFHFEFVCQYLVHIFDMFKRLADVLVDKFCSCSMMETMVLVFISVTKVLGLPLHGAM